MVLLQNKNHTLPIGEKGKIALYGGAAYGTVKGGSGSGAVNQREAINVYQGFKRAGYEVVTAGWLEDYGKKYDLVNSKELVIKRYGLLEYVPEALLTEAEVEEAASETEIGVYVVGRNSGSPGSAFDASGWTKRWRCSCGGSERHNSTFRKTYGYLGGSL